MKMQHVASKCAEVWFVLLNNLHLWTYRKFQRKPLLVQGPLLPKHFEMDSGLWWALNGGEEGARNTPSCPAGLLPNGPQSGLAATERATEFLWIGTVAKKSWVGNGEASVVGHSQSRRNVKSTGVQWTVGLRTGGAESVRSLLSSHCYSKSRRTWLSLSLSLPHSFLYNFT